MDKNQAMIAFLQACPTIQSNPLFFNFGKVENDAYQATVKSDDISLHKNYIDGSVLRRYTFSVDSYKSVAYNPVISGYTDENMEDFNSVQAVLDWINEQADNGNYPAFDDTCVIEKMATLTTKPELLGVDNEVNPPVAVYRISIQIDYIDTSKRIWNKEEIISA